MVNRVKDPEGANFVADKMAHPPEKFNYYQGSGDLQECWPCGSANDRQERQVAVVKAAQEFVGCTDEQDCDRSCRREPDCVLQKSLADQWLGRVAWKEVLKQEQEWHHKVQRGIE